MEKDLITVIAVAYNAEKTLQRTLDSISSQQYVRMELVFINDASTDTTLKIVNEFKDSYPSIPCTIVTNQTNQGITKSRNIALSHVHGDFIAVLDSDDVWSNPYKLKKQLDFLNQNPDHILVGTQIHVTDLNGMILKTTQYKTEDTEIKNKMLILNQIAHSSVLMRKTNTTYDETFSIWEDYDFFLKLGITHKLANIDEVMVNYLYAPKKYTLKKKLKNTAAEIQIIKKYKKQYPNFWIGYVKGILKYILIFLHLK